MAGRAPPRLSPGGRWSYSSLTVTSLKNALLASAAVFEPVMMSRPRMGRWSDEPPTITSTASGLREMAEIAWGAYYRAGNAEQLYDCAASFLWARMSNGG